MNIKQLSRSAQRFVTANAPVILTIAGATGVVATAVLSGKAAYKSALILSDEEVTRQALSETPIEFGLKEKAPLVWKEYIAPVVVGSLSVAAIIGAHRIDAKRAAALAAAYTLSERAHSEYKDKIQEKLGIKKEQAISDEISSDRVHKHPPSAAGIIDTGKGDTVFRDGFSGRYFTHDFELVRKAVNDVNQQVWNHESCAVTQFYTNLGLSATDISDDFGWDHDKPMKINPSTTTTEDGKLAVHSLTYEVIPLVEFWRGRR